MDNKTKVNWSDLFLDVIWDSIIKLDKLGDKARRTDRLSQRRNKDIMIADRIAEKILIQKIRVNKINAVIISEEIGKKTIKGNGKRFYIVMDPFDGSSLFKRNINLMWYLSIAVYDENKSPIVAYVVNLNDKTIYFSDKGKSFQAVLESRKKLKKTRLLKPSQCVSLKESSIATYMMKPKYLITTIKKFSKILYGTKFIFPNGGPGCVAQVCSGEIEALLVNDEKTMELFSAFPLTVSSGVIVTDLKGNPIGLDENQLRCSALVSANSKIHDEILKKLNSK
ncbi:MAG: hypothetical protein OEL81_02665 [Nitrosopumilus sp.]|nr:hypothetical protein [Nitrosopumilus sp.]